MLLISDQYDDIPVETSGRDVPEGLESFEAIEFPPSLAANITRCNYSKPTPVQKNAVPIALAARDLMACAQTGSGKTAAFLLPIIAMMLVRGKDEAPPPGRKWRPMGLVLAPTRELATQIQEQARRVRLVDWTC